MVSVVLVHCGRGVRLLDIRWTRKQEWVQTRAVGLTSKDPRDLIPSARLESPQNSATNSLKHEPRRHSSDANQPYPFSRSPALRVVVVNISFFADIFKATASQLRGAGRSAVGISTQRE